MPTGGCTMGASSRGSARGKAGRPSPRSPEPSIDLLAGDEAAGRLVRAKPLALRSSAKLVGAHIVSGEALA